MERRLSIGLGPSGALDFSVSFQHRLLDLVPFLLLSPRFRTPAWAQAFPSRAPVPIWIKEAVLLRWQGKGIAGHCRLSISGFVKHFHSCSKKKTNPSCICCSDGRVWSPARRCVFSSRQGAGCCFVLRDCRDSLLTAAGARGMCCQWALQFLLVWCLEIQFCWTCRIPVNFAYQWLLCISAGKMVIFFHSLPGVRAKERGLWEKMKKIQAGYKPEQEMQRQARPRGEGAQKWHKLVSRQSITQKIFSVCSLASEEDLEENTHLAPC